MRTEEKRTWLFIILSYITILLFLYIPNIFTAILISFCIGTAIFYCIKWGMKLKKLYK